MLLYAVLMMIVSIDEADSLTVMASFFVWDVHKQKRRRFRGSIDLSLLLSHTLT